MDTRRTRRTGFSGCPLRNVGFHSISIPHGPLNLHSSTSASLASVMYSCLGGVLSVPEIFCHEYRVVGGGGGWTETGEEAEFISDGNCLSFTSLNERRLVVACKSSGLQCETCALINIEQPKIDITRGDGILSKNKGSPFRVCGSLVIAACLISAPEPLYVRLGRLGVSWLHTRNCTRRTIHGLDYPWVPIYSWLWQQMHMQVTISKTFRRFRPTLFL
jgi:hypothetical protein